MNEANIFFQIQTSFGHKHQIPLENSKTMWTERKILPKNADEHRWKRSPTTSNFAASLTVHNPNASLTSHLQSILQHCCQHHTEPAPSLLLVSRSSTKLTPIGELRCFGESAASITCKSSQSIASWSQPWQVSFLDILIIQQLCGAFLWPGDGFGEWALAIVLLGCFGVLLLIVLFTPAMACRSVDWSAHEVEVD